MCELEGWIEFLTIHFPTEAAYFWSKVRVIVFPAAWWDVCHVCVGDNGVEVCYCGVYGGNWNGIDGEILLPCFIH